LHNQENKTKRTFNCQICSIPEFLIAGITFSSRYNRTKKLTSAFKLHLQ